MVTKEDIESFLDRLALTARAYPEVEPGLWIVKPERRAAISRSS